MLGILREFNLWNILLYVLVALLFLRGYLELRSPIKMVRLFELRNFSKSGIKHLVLGGIYAEINACSSVLKDYLDDCVLHWTSFMFGIDA